MVTSVFKLIHYPLNFLLPPRCLLCYERSTDPQGICFKCWQSLDFICDPYCQLCGSPFEFKVEENLVCAPCLDDAPSFDRARSSVVYTTTSRHILMGFKHGDMLQVAKILARWMGHTGAEFLKEADLIVSVPLHPLRLIWRQYNQAAILVNELAKIANKPRQNEILKRCRYTPSQGKKTLKERQKNIKAAFKVNPKYNEAVQGKRILLVDDVLTTGATVEECSKVLKKAGARSVDVLTFARVTPSSWNR